MAAESADCAASFCIRHSDDASGDHYVCTATGHSGSATFAFSVPAEGSFCLYARAKGDAFTESSFRVSVDSGERIWYRIPYHDGGWNWGRSEVEPDATSDCWTLTAGSHEIVFSGREPYAYLDCIVLTNDAGYMPTD